MEQKDAGMSASEETSISTNGRRFHERVVCGYLYVVSKHGFPPMVEDTVFHLHEMAHAGFSSVEVEANRPSQMAWIYRNRKLIKQALVKLKLQVPYFCAILPGLSSPHSSERKENLNTFEKACETAKLFGSKGIFDNAPLPPYQFPGDIPIVRHFSDEILMSGSIPEGLEWPRYWDAMIGTYRDACDIAAGHGLTFQMHPALGVLASTTDGFLHFHDAVGRDNLRFNIDTANQFMMRDNLTLSLIRVKDYLDYIHLSDNRGHRIEHLLPGQGSIHWGSFFDTLERIGFKGEIGVDIGGAESEIGNLEEAYRRAAGRLEQLLKLVP